jgi:hypothetical protein
MRTISKHFRWPENKRDIAENETLCPKTYTPIYRHEKRQKLDDPAFPP